MNSQFCLCSIDGVMIGTRAIATDTIQRETHAYFSPFATCHARPCSTIDTRKLTSRRNLGELHSKTQKLTTLSRPGSRRLRRSRLSLLRLPSDLLSNRSRPLSRSPRSRLLRSRTTGMSSAAMVGEAACAWPLDSAKYSPSHVKTVKKTLNRMKQHQRPPD